MNNPVDKLTFIGKHLLKNCEISVKQYVNDSRFQHANFDLWNPLVELVRLRLDVSIVMHSPQAYYYYYPI